MPPMNRGQLGLAPWVFAAITLGSASSVWARAEAPADPRASGDARPTAQAQPQAAVGAKAEGAVVPETTRFGAAQPGPAASPGGAALDYALQAAQALDSYLDKVIQALQSASREGPDGFDLRLPKLMGPAGRPLPLVYTERLTDRLINHPASADFLTRDDLAAGLRGRQVLVRDGQIVVTSVNPGGASAIGVAIPAADLTKRLPDAAEPGGILLFDAAGHPVAVNGELTADQLGIFERFLPQRPPSLIVTEAHFSVAASTRSDLLVVTRMLSGGAAPEVPSPGSLFVAPTLLATSTPDPRADLLSRAAIVLPVGAGVLGGLAVILFRLRGRRPRGGSRGSARGAMPELPDLDYLDALSEPTSATAAGSADPSEATMAIEGEDAVVTSYQAPEAFREGVGEVRVLKKKEARDPQEARRGATEPPAASLAARRAGSVADTGTTIEDEHGKATIARGDPPDGDQAETRAVMQAGNRAGMGSETAEGEAMEPSTQPESEASKADAESVANARAGSGEGVEPDAKARTDSDEEAEPVAKAGSDADQGLEEGTNAETAEGKTSASIGEDPGQPSEEARPAEVDRLLADLIESTSQEALARDEPEGEGRERSESATEENTELRRRASSLKERLAERLDFFKTSARGSDPGAASPAAPASHGPAPQPAGPASQREVIHVGRSGGTDEPTDFRRKQKTVNPGDVLITKGEAQSIVEKEADRVLTRMQGLVREVEIRTAEALSIHRETFRELLEQFEALQENRDRDLAEMHDLRNQLANEVTAATLKLKQAEARATEGMLRLKEQVDNLTRKLEGWAVDARISEERLTGALETIREGWENQMEAHAELRKEVMRLAESLQDLGRKQEASADREAGERRAAIDQLAFEIKTVQLGTENDFSVMASRLDELKSGIASLSQRLDRTEGQQAQAIDALNRKIDAGEAVEALKQRLGLELETLKGQLYEEIERGLAASSRGNLAYQEQIDALKEENARLSQRQHQMVQLLANLHSALGKSDARAAEEVERLKAQNAELQQMMLSMLRSGQRPTAQAPHAAGQGQVPRRQPPQAAVHPHAPQPPVPGYAPAPQAQPQGGSPSRAPGQAHPVAPPGQSPDPAAPTTGAQLPEIPARSAAEPRHRAEPEEPVHEPRPIDLWSRLMGRDRHSDEQASQRKRRSK